MASVEVKVPTLGESINEATIIEWQKHQGDAVAVGDVLVILETDKVDFEVGADQEGILSAVHFQEGDDMRVGDVLAEIDPQGQPSDEVASKAAAEKNQPVEAPLENVESREPEAQPEQAEATEPVREKVTPVARRFAKDKGVDLSEISPKGERITKADVEDKLSGNGREKPQSQEKLSETPQSFAGARREERIRMSRRRQTIARRLVEAQQTAAMLTTFNDVNMAKVMELRSQRKESFLKKHDVKLGITSFFVKAAIGALKGFPRLNAEIDGDEMVIKHYYDIGIAVGAEEGLVVPVLHDADRMNFAEIEIAIRDFVQKVQNKTLTLEDLRGGTFSITNGGIYGSLLSTPILNPPQVGILGLHRIEDRPIVMDGEISIQPMMNLALSYDHRIVDGREAVQFLAQVKELIEDPDQLLLEG